MSISLLELAKIVKTEKDALAFLCKEREKLGYKIECPFCDSRNYFVIGRGKLRCKNCRKDYNPFSNTIFNKVKIGYRKWLLLIKLFEIETSARKASKEVKISYTTALKAFNLLRQIIASELAKNDEILKGEIEADEAYFGGKRKGKRGRGSKNKIIVFGILERKGKVSVSIVRDVKAETLMKETVKKVRRGSIVYTDKWRGYDSLMFCGYRHLSIDHGKRFSRGKVYINGIEGFWSFAKERLIKHHGISPGKFLYYIKEQEWRYNNRDRDLYSLLLKYVMVAEYV